MIASGARRTDSWKISSSLTRFSSRERPLGALIHRQTAGCTRQLVLTDHYRILQRYAFETRLRDVLTS